MVMKKLLYTDKNKWISMISMNRMVEACSSQF